MECRRPERTDVHLHLSKEEAAKIEEETRDYFDGLAPKRHSKPQRSDYAATYNDALSDVDGSGGLIPEFAEFQRLKNDPQKLVYSGGQFAEEFVETEYYKDLAGVDKEHHATGTEFIKVDGMKGNSFSFAPDPVMDCHGSLKGNPATNDWIPAADNAVNFMADKPKRSDN